MITTCLSLFLGAAFNTVEIKVVDEQGKPLPTATVRAQWVPEPAQDPWNAAAKVVPQVVAVNPQGEARLQGRHLHTRLIIEVTAPGFYSLIRRHGFKEVPLECRMLARGPHSPCRSVQVEFKALPPIGQEVGFDLERASWLPPLGVGQVADVMITLLAEGVHLRWPEPETGVHIVPLPGGEGYSAALGLAHPRDALFELNHARRAPATGYARELHLPKPRHARYIVRFKRGDLWVYAVVSSISYQPTSRLGLGYIVGEPTAGDSIEFMPPPYRQVSR